MEVIDGKRMTLMPGLVEAHSHITYSNMANFKDLGQMPLEEWARLWVATDTDERLLAPEERPLAVAVRERKPVQDDFFMRGSDGVVRRLMVTAIPLEAADGTHLGAVAIFWET